MKKNISAALLTLACFSALSAAAFADGPVGRAMNGIGRAGEDIADGVGDAVSGAGDAVSDVVGGVTGDDSDTASDPLTSDEPVGDNSDVVSDDLSDAASSDVSDISSDPEPSNSGIVGGITDVNPPAGVSYGLTAGAAVLAALGVVVAASARKDK